MIELREYMASDVEDLVRLANNKNVSRYLVDTFPYPYTRSDAEWWIDTGSKEGGAVTKVIEYQGLLVGSIGIRPQTGWRSHIAEIGYWVGEAYWGIGIASEALERMSRLAFSQYAYRKLIAPVLGPNEASVRVLKKNCYFLEGVLKEEVFKDGEYFDIHQYARIAGGRTMGCSASPGAPART